MLEVELELKPDPCLYFVIDFILRTNIVFIPLLITFF